MKLRSIIICGFAAIAAATAPATFAQSQSDATFTQTAYLKPFNTGANDQFGYAVAISGNTAVVGAHFESSNARGVNGDGTNNSAGSSGAAYVFVRNATGWSQQAYLKALDSSIAFDFGHAVAISGDTIVVGAPGQRGGRAYVFVRTGSTWSEQQQLKASNVEPFDAFGTSVAISGETIIVGAFAEDSNAIGVDQEPNDDLNNDNDVALESGAAYVFVRENGVWTQEAYLKASNTQQSDNFGWSVGISGDTAVVGAFRESSNAKGIDGDQTNNSASQAGAAYVFNRSGTTWTPGAYLKASNTGIGDCFGWSVGISGDTIVIGAPIEGSNATGVIGADQTNNSVTAAGAAYVFIRSGMTWVQQAYLKASNTQPNVGDRFAHAIDISGNVIVAGAIEEDSGAVGVNGNQADNSVTGAGAAYVFVRSGGSWSQHSYLKASNPGFDDSFGQGVSVSAGTVIVGAFQEGSNSTVVNGEQTNEGALHSGAAYAFEVSNTAPTVETADVARWPNTSTNLVIATVDDADDGPGFLDVMIESANPSHGVTLSGLSNAAGTVTADVSVAPGASTASFQIRAVDRWGTATDATFTVTVVPRVVVTAAISPEANANGWHNGPVTVSWTVDHSTTQTNCAPAVLSAETALDGTTLTCTAANAGGSMSQSATVRIDLTAPAGTALRTPAANVSGWNNSDVAVTFTCADALSGVVSPGSTDTITTEGAAQSRGFTCVDGAGNARPLSVTNVNIDKTPPTVAPESVAATPNPAMVNTTISVSAGLTDAGSSGLARAEVKVGTGGYALLAPASTTSATANGSIGSFAEPGVLETCVRAVDLAGNQSAEECLLIAVFDPTAGYVTGAGTIDSPVGALVGSLATGTARFGFQSKYARGATTPSGNTQFRFRAGDLDFDSTAYEWLVVAGARAQYKGVGTIRNREGTFAFLLTVIDGDQPGGGGIDRFRIKITGPSGVVYDNQMDVADNADPTTAIAGGHIVIRK